MQLMGIRGRTIRTVIALAVVLVAVVPRAAAGEDRPQSCAREQAVFVAQGALPDAVALLPAKARPEGDVHDRLPTVAGGPAAVVTVVVTVLPRPGQLGVADAWPMSGSVLRPQLSRWQI
jgi:hypothetical protein